MFTVIAEYTGLNWKKDESIIRAAGRPDSGSGYFFGDDSRDLTFEFHRKTAALKAAARIRRLHRVKARVVHYKD